MFVNIFIKFTSIIILTLLNYSSEAEGCFEMEKEGKFFFVQKKYLKEVPYLLSLASDASIPCDTWVRSSSARC